jgi:hypothetical protein
LMERYSFVSEKRCAMSAGVILFQNGDHVFVRVSPPER